MDRSRKSKVGLLDLPNEVLLEILFNLDIDDIHVTCVRVNQRLKNLINANFDTIDHIHLKYQLFPNEDFPAGMAKFLAYVTNRKPNIQALTISLDYDWLVVTEAARRTVEQNLLTSLVQLKTLQYINFNDWISTSCCLRLLRICFASLPDLKFASIPDKGHEHTVHKIALESIKAKTLHVTYKNGAIPVFGDCCHTRFEKNPSLKANTTTTLQLDAMDGAMFNNFHPCILVRFPNVTLLNISIHWYLVITDYFCS